ncbi:MAG: hypothetical protein JJU30_11295 [Alkalimonas sp.]|nr:hypothetical protein [Alkalimonas sp.]
MSHPILFHPDALQNHELTAEHVAFFYRLNEQLASIETRLQQHDCHPNGYDHPKAAVQLCQVIVQFRLSPEDTHYHPAYDDCLFRMQINSHDPIFKAGLLSEQDWHSHDHTCSAIYTGFDFKHCYLFARLYQESGLGWANLLRIGAIELRYHIEESHFIELQPIKRWQSQQLHVADTIKASQHMQLLCQVLQLTVSGDISHEQALRDQNDPAESFCYIHQGQSLELRGRASANNSWMQIQALWEAEPLVGEGIDIRALYYQLSEARSNDVMVVLQGPFRYQHGVLQLLAPSVQLLELPVAALTARTTPDSN